MEEKEEQKKWHTKHTTFSVPGTVCRQMVLQWIPVCSVVVVRTCGVVGDVCAGDDIFVAVVVAAVAVDIKQLKLRPPLIIQQRRRRV